MVAVVTTYKFLGRGVVGEREVCMNAFLVCLGSSSRLRTFTHFNIRWNLRLVSPIQAPLQANQLVQRIIEPKVGKLKHVHPLEWNKVMRIEKIHGKPRMAMPRHLRMCRWMSTSKQVLSPRVVRGKGRPPSLRRASMMETNLQKAKAKTKRVQGKGKRKERDGGDTPALGTCRNLFGTSEDDTTHVHDVQTVPDIRTVVQETVVAIQESMQFELDGSQPVENIGLEGSQPTQPYGDGSQSAQLDGNK